MKFARMTGNKNLFIAIALSALVLFAWQYFIATPQMKAEQARQATLAHQEKKLPSIGAPGTPAPAIPGMSGTTVHMTREAALKIGGMRVAINTPMLDGSILLKGAKLDDLRLKKYHETIDPRSPEIVLLAPKSTDYPYYAVFGWGRRPPLLPINPCRTIKAPGSSKARVTLSPGHPVTLTWKNGHGLSSPASLPSTTNTCSPSRTVSANASGAAATLYPYAYVAREGVRPRKTTWVLHTGFVGVANGSEIDAKYDDFKDPGTAPKTFSSTAAGWGLPTNTGWPRSCRPRAKAIAAPIWAARDGDIKAFQANYRLNRVPSHRAPACQSPIACSRAPRWSTS